MEQPADTPGHGSAAEPGGTPGAGGGSTSDDAQGHAVAVTVVRSGGFAGLKRTWEATTDDPAAAEGWLGLADSLPWGRPAAHDPRSADRFVYRIVIVVRTRVRHEAILPESELTGAWRDLVDLVQKEGDKTA